MVKRAVFLSVVFVGVLVALSASTDVWGKAHVPLGRAQICTSEGEVKNVTARALGSKLRGGACRLPACAFNEVDEQGMMIQQFIFLPGDSCDSFDGNHDGFCDATGSPSDIPKRLKANNVTPACTDPF